MKLRHLTLATAILPVAFCQGAPTQGRVNPFLTPYTTQMDIPPFAQIEISDYIPAFEAGIAEGNANIRAIVSNPETPTFENTINAMDHAAPILTRVSRVFFSLSESDSSPELVAIAEEVSPKVSAYSDGIMMDDALFSRVRQIYDNRESLGLTTAQKRAVEQRYKDFVRNGALLSAADKEKLKELNSELSSLYLLYNKNLLNATNEFAIFVNDPAELSGLPAATVAVAANEAKTRGKEGQWAFTLHAPSRLAVLSSADNRDLRRKMYEGYTSLASEGQYDNRPVINRILRVRSQKAQLLGYPDYATYMTENVMAKNPQNAIDLIMKVWAPARQRVNEEVAEMQAIVDEENGGFKIEPWDYYYYSEKVRLKKYDLDEALLRPYFSVDSVRKGIFNLAEKLYGVTFRELPDAPKYHPDVNVYECLDRDGSHLAIFMTDYFTRPSKRQGAWMDELKSSYVDTTGAVRPIIYNVCNFAKPTESSPSLLSIDDVRTMFHEFGHGLHGMLSRAQYVCQSGTAVDRDFVELPSQINEHWALEPELLATYAHHYLTGETIPEDLVNKLQAASAHNAGFDLVERLGASYLDLCYGKLNPTEDIDIFEFEKTVGNQLGMPDEIQYRYRSPYFKHIFGSDGYASGYYTYLWAEVLDTDGYELFQENGIFDHATAESFRHNILEMGGSEDPMELFVKFRGRQPDPQALLRRYHLLPDNNNPRLTMPDDALKH